MQVALLLAMVALAHAHDGDKAGATHDIHARIRRLQRAAVGVAVHGGQIFFDDRLHGHALLLADPVSICNLNASKGSAVEPVVRKRKAGADRSGDVYVLWRTGDTQPAMEEFRKELLDWSHALAPSSSTNKMLLNK